MHIQCSTHTYIKRLYDSTWTWTRMHMHVCMSERTSYPWFYWTKASTYKKKTKKNTVKKAAIHVIFYRLCDPTYTNTHAYSSLPIPPSQSTQYKPKYTVYTHIMHTHTCTVHVHTQGMHTHIDAHMHAHTHTYTQMHMHTWTHTRMITPHSIPQVFKPKVLLLHKQTQTLSLKLTQLTPTHTHTQ